MSHIQLSSFVQHEINKLQTFLGVTDARCTMHCLFWLLNKGQNPEMGNVVVNFLRGGAICHYGTSFLRLWHSTPTLCFGCLFVTGAVPEQPSTGNPKPCVSAQGPLLQRAGCSSNISWHWEPLLPCTGVGESTPVLEKLLGRRLQHNTERRQQGTSVAALTPSAHVACSTSVYYAVPHCLLPTLYICAKYSHCSLGIKHVFT